MLFSIIEGGLWSSIKTVQKMATEGILVLDSTCNEEWYIMKQNLNVLTYIKPQP